MEDILAVVSEVQVTRVAAAATHVTNEDNSLKEAARVFFGGILKKEMPGLYPCFLCNF